MSIITISRGSYSKGKEVAEKVAARLGYECISREVLLEASNEFNIPEIRLVRAIHDAPSILGRFLYGKEKYIAFIQATICKHFLKNNVVYYGLAGHFFVGGISHALRVRIVADLADRVKNEMDREGIPAKEAEHVLKKDDRERRSWSKFLYGIDTRDPHNYDLILHIKTITVDDAAEIICHTVAREHFRATPDSRKAMADRALAADVKAALVNSRPDVEVQANDGLVQVYTAASESEEEAIIKELTSIAGSISGVKQVKIHVRMTYSID